MKLNPHVKRKWLKALRSGEYQKGMARLGWVGNGGSTRFCCLGVLACEMVPEFVKTVVVEIKLDGNISYLPDDLACLWGLEDDTQVKLSNLNDRNINWGRVIDYIEKNL